MRSLLLWKSKTFKDKFYNFQSKIITLLSLLASIIILFYVSYARILKLILSLLLKSFFIITFNFSRNTIGTLFKLRFITLLSLLFYANLSLALGLGDAELNSNLGERFLAKVEVTDVQSTPESNCFSATDLGNIPAFSNALVNLKASNNGNFQLTISTIEIITEPIVNLRISFHCEPNVNREYVLLLDPAPLSVVENTITKHENSQIEPNLNTTNKQNQKSHQTSIKKSSSFQKNEQTDTKFLDKPALKKVPEIKKHNSLNTTNEKLLEAYTGKQNSPTPQSDLSPAGKASSFHPSTDKPFLVISSENTNVSEVKPGLSLRLATEIDVTRPDEFAVQQPSTDTIDEVTVMSKRLSYLEKQITSLQTRNAKLVTEAQNAKVESANLDWLQFSKIMLGILAALGVLEFLRRKLSNRQAIAKEAWFDDEKLAATYGKPSSINANFANEFEFQNTNPSSFNETNFIDPSLHNLSASDVKSIGLEVKEEQGSILEDAEVFIEHGRPALAAQLLQNYLIDFPAESPAIWLKLLDLLSKEGTETEYDAAVVECNNNFNIKAVKYGSSLSDNTSIEDYPQILGHLIVSQGEKKEPNKTGKGGKNNLKEKEGWKGRMED